MKHDDVQVRRIGRSQNAVIGVIVGALIAVVVLLTLVLEGGALLATGELAPGGFNPGAIVMGFIRGGQWNWGHTVSVGLVALVAAGVAYGLLRARRRRPAKVRGDQRAKHMGSARSFTKEAVQQHAAAAQLSDDGVVGLPLGEVISTGETFWVGFRDGALGEMGPGSGKTAACVVPGTLHAPGPVWVTSNKVDVAALLYSSRERGRTFIFDPQQIAQMDPLFFYDPLRDIRDGRTTRVRPDGSTTILDQRQTRSTALAAELANSSRPVDAKTDAFFDPAGRRLLANLMLAAAVEELPITQVLSWAFKPDSQRPGDILRQHGLILAAESYESVQNLYHETRDSVFETASNIISFLQDDAGQAWVQRMGPDDNRPEFVPSEFVRSEADLMICLSREGIGSFGPVLAAMTNATIRAGEDYAASLPAGRLPVPAVFQLDEVANVCRIQALPDLVSHVGSRGIFSAPYLQSAAQGRAAWGNDGWDKLFGATTVRLIGRGLIDIKHLQDMSAAIGEQPVMRYTTGSSGGGPFSRNNSVSSNEHWTMEPIMSVADLVSLPQWRAVVIPSGERAALLRLRPYFDDPELDARVARSKAAFLALRPQLAGAVAAAEAEDIGDPVAVDAEPQAS
jgi:type IV secretory pathway TraG/TraD family ATPase VirD4